MNYNTLIPRLSATTLLVVLLGACRDSGPSPSLLPTAPRPGGIPVYAGGPASKDIKPTGTGLGVADDTAPPPRTRYRLENHNGAFLTGNVTVYLIWYGSWASNIADQLILANLVSAIAETPYFSIARLYSNAAGQTPTASLIYGGSELDSYSHSATINDADVEAIVAGQIVANGLPVNENTVYVVVASPDIWESSGLDVTYCAFHNTGVVNGKSFRYAFVANPARSPQRCGPQGQGPNQNWTGDATASLLAAELFNMVTDPGFGAWYDKLGLEGADKCAWTYGTTHTTANGGQANVRLGPFEYLLQQLWVPSKNGGACGLHG
jgi:hypothetical protein